MIELIIFKKQKLFHKEYLVSTSSSLINFILFKLTTGAYKEMLIDRFQLMLYSDQEKIKFEGKYDVYSLLVKPHLITKETVRDVFITDMSLEEKLAYMYIYTYGNLIGNNDKILKHLVKMYIHGTLDKYEQYLIYKDEINLDKVIKDTVLLGAYDIEDILKQPEVTYKVTVCVKDLRVKLC